MKVDFLPRILVDAVINISVFINTVLKQIKDREK